MTLPSTPPPRRYRWLARKSVATQRRRHVFVEYDAVSLCTYASRMVDRDDWVLDPEREACVHCAKELITTRGLTEVQW